jgi:hypothetical protein
LQLKDFSKIKQMMDKKARRLNTFARLRAVFQRISPAFLNFSPEILAFEKIKKGVTFIYMERRTEHADI